MSISAIKESRHYLDIQLHLWTPYESINDTIQCSYIMPKLLEAVVIRPHPIASADSSIMGHACERILICIPLMCVYGYFYEREVHGDTVKDKCL